MLVGAASQMPEILRKKAQAVGFSPNSMRDVEVEIVRCSLRAVTLQVRPLGYLNQFAKNEPSVL